MKVALATSDVVPREFDDDELLADALRARGAEAHFVSWDADAAAWSTFDLVAIRSTWDYTARRAEFVAWAESVGERLRNPPELVRWNSDKRYLADLAEAGLPVVPTTFIAPGETPPSLCAEVVVKPSVSAGARDTGRFGAAAQDAARRLIEAITRDGRTAMVQPYLQAVDAVGETALVFVAGELAHVLRKRAVLAPDEVASTRNDALGAAEAMYDPTLVTIGAADEREVAVAQAVVAHLRQRFGAPPLVARVDLVPGGNGAPVLLELEAIEPNLYLRQAPGTAQLLADAILAELDCR